MKNFSEQKLNRPFISVVIPALNEEKFLSATLQSLTEQDYKNFEVLVVDNNSQDQTAKIAQDFGYKVIFEPKKGVGAARQAGFMATSGEIIASTDADTVVPKDWLSTIAAEFAKDENLAAFGGLYNLSSGSVVTKIAVSFLAYPAHYLDKFLSSGWNLPGANFAVRKTCFLKTGGFNVNFQINEEYDLSQRIRKFGKVKLNPRFLVKTSGRGYKYGFVSWFLRYGAVTFTRIVFKRHSFNKLKTVRQEPSVFNRVILEPLLIGLVVIFLVAASPPFLAEAKGGVAFVHRKIISADHQIKKGERQIRTITIDKVKKLRHKQTIN